MKIADITPEITKVISFSGGRSSGMMLYKCHKESDIVLFANTGKEKEGTLKFVKNCQDHFGIDIIWLEYCPVNGFKIVDYNTASRKGEPFSALIAKRKFLPNVVTRFCTTELKIRPMSKYLKSIGIKGKDVEMAIGIRHDEERRYQRNKGEMKSIGWERVMPLYDMKITKPDVDLFWKTMPFDLEIQNHQGNCDLCFLKGITKKINILREDPSVAEWWIKEEEKSGNLFVKNMSVKELLQIATTQQLIPFEDDDVDCYCTID